MVSVKNIYRQFASLAIFTTRRNTTTALFAKQYRSNILRTTRCISLRALRRALAMDHLDATSAIRLDEAQIINFFLQTLNHQITRLWLYIYPYPLTT